MTEDAPEKSPAPPEAPPAMPVPIEVQLVRARWATISNITLMLCGTVMFCTCVIATCD